MKGIRIRVARTGQKGMEEEDEHEHGGAEGGARTDSRGHTAGAQLPVWEAQGASPRKAAGTVVAWGSEPVPGPREHRRWTPDAVAADRAEMGPSDTLQNPRARPPAQALTALLFLAERCMSKP